MTSALSAGATPAASATGAVPGPPAGASASTTSSMRDISNLTASGQAAGGQAHAYTTRTPPFRLSAASETRPKPAVEARTGGERSRLGTPLGFSPRDDGISQPREPPWRSGTPAILPNS